MPRVFLLCLLVFQAAEAFVSQPQEANGVTKLTTVSVSSSVAWDSSVEEAQRKPKFSWIRRPASKLWRKRLLIVHAQEVIEDAYESVVDEEVAKTAEVVPNVVSKVQEFRTKPLRIPSQPRPLREERKLAAKYAKIESLEERAFQILVDLNMVEIHN